MWKLEKNILPYSPRSFAALRTRLWRFRARDSLIFDHDGQRHLGTVHIRGTGVDHNGRERFLL